MKGLKIALRGIPSKTNTRGTRYYAHRAGHTQQVFFKGFSAIAPGFEPSSKISHALVQGDSFDFECCGLLSEPATKNLRRIRTGRWAG